MTLFEIDNTINTVLENGVKVDEETGEVLFLEEDLEQLNLDRKTKIENIALFIKNKEALAADIAEEIKNLTERKKTVERKAERLKEYLDFSLGGKEFETARCEVKYRKCPPSVEMDIEPEELPTQYVRIEQKYSADKKAIKEALKAGKKVKGCRLIENVKMLIK